MIDFYFRIVNTNCVAFLTIVVVVVLFSFLFLIDLSFTVFSIENFSY